MSKAGRGAEQISLRLPEGMRDRLKAAADANGRSVNSEIILRLQNALERQEDGSISVWLPKEVLDRVYEEAHEAEIDPNLLILEAVEKEYPPRRDVTRLAQELIDEIELSRAGSSESAKDVAKALQILIDKEFPPAPTPPWKKRGK
ncbi:Arc family DNA-binding protein [Aureimonas mangrovi]|uniref:Arc family DNA-binding protein n=1 Tax=Aureimonas mangrovi TaxID=2758041 RepID=UPI00163DCCA0|nr:Arc family DNA-binding protein [Aureimonas mangrovi]